MILSEIITKETEYSKVSECIDSQFASNSKTPILVTGLCDGARTAFLSEQIKRNKSKNGSISYIIVPNEKLANRLNNDLIDYGVNSLVFPWREMVKHNVTASHDLEHERLFVLFSIINNTCDCVILTPDSALQYTVSKQKLTDTTLLISKEREYNPSLLCKMLVSCGYKECDIVDGIGQFSVRGGILDIFVSTEKNPIRIDFFGEEIDSISYFDIITQRRYEDIDQFTILPSRETSFSKDEISKIISLIDEVLKDSDNERISSILNNEKELLQNGLQINSADKYLGYIYQQSSIIDYIDIDSPVFFIDENGINDKLEAYKTQSQFTAQDYIDIGIPTEYASDGKKANDLLDLQKKHVVLWLNTFVSGKSSKKLSGLFTFNTRQNTSYSDNNNILLEDLLSHLRGEYKIYILTENETQQNSIVSFLDENAITSYISGEPSIGHPIVLNGINIPTFELPHSKYAIFSTYPISAQGDKKTLIRAKKKRKKKEAGQTILSYADLVEGDYVVHENHGIGQYLGLTSLVVDKVRRDYVKIKYAGKDVLYLPCEQLDSITKYIGPKSEDGSLKLSKMGGDAWIKTKAKAKKAATDMAKDLIAIYSQRLKKQGFAFPEDDDFQSGFEQEFEYEETDDQIKAISEIKRDMQSVVPMDRLLCGDVGFGKTEVALRAAFKAVSSSKQVAVLVPTTILALQHYQTFTQRMRGYPIKIDMISRFKSSTEQKETLNKLRRGEIDIIVGTHRIISKDIKFKDLGLVIIDEEQRFGVAQKEKLKQITTDVDVLTLSATPIPRTLNMAMSGIRDMSILEEAPGERLPVQTYVLEYDYQTISDAIGAELRRGGQVFYLYNKVETINDIANKIAEMAPEARIAVAHGQMDKEDLSKIWEMMVQGEIDILVSTTIIETGIDIPNANTLIIENADNMGLSQLHQIRGRIGRSARRAYAYFTYPQGKVLTEISEKRLTAIRDYTEFGAGFKIALRDLEIRGAGNLLGSEQHGHIDSVGYDLYMKILNQAISEEKGIITKPKVSCSIDFQENAFIPESYIKSEAQRIEIYKKIAGIETEEDQRDVTDEIIDRYGDIPKSVVNLLDIAFLRSCGEMASIKRISKKSTNILLYPDKYDADKWLKILNNHKGRLMIHPGDNTYIIFRTKDLPNSLRATQGLLIEYANLLKKEDNSEIEE